MLVTVGGVAGQSGLTIHGNERACRLNASTHLPYSAAIFHRCENLKKQAAISSISTETKTGSNPVWNLFLGRLIVSFCRF